MKKIVKQVVGIDVAQKELVVSLGHMYDDWTPELYAHKTFPNTKKALRHYWMGEEITVVRLLYVM